MNKKLIFLLLLYMIRFSETIIGMEQTQEKVGFPFDALDLELKIYIFSLEIEKIIEDSEDDLEAFENMVASKFLKVLSLTSKDFRALVPPLRGSFFNLLYTRFSNPYVEKSLEEKNEIIQEILYAGEAGKRSSLDEMRAAQALLANSNLNSSQKVSHQTSPLLLQAIKCSYIRLAKLLIIMGFDINKTNQNGYTALMLSIRELSGQKELPDMVKLLLERGIDVNAKSDSKITALSLAVFYRYKTSDATIVKLLLAYKADVDAKDIDGNTPLTLAKEGGYKEEMVSLLKQARRKKCIVS